MAELFEDPAEKQTAMTKLDMLTKFIAEFDLLAQIAGYKLPNHNEFMCHIFRMNVHPCTLDQLFNRGVAMNNYAVMKSEAIKAEAANRERDNEQRLQGHPVGKGCPFVPTPSTLVKPNMGMIFGGQGQPMDLSQVESHGLCFTCHQKGHISHNCSQKHKAMVRKMLGEMLGAERTELLQVKEEKKEDVQGFQQPQQ